jgi:hypothetical protein
VAKRLKVSPQHVREVFFGRRKSARVLKALERELAKIGGVERAA